jgi:dTMP kinase
MFVVFKGIDGSGKLTQARLLAQHMREEHKQTPVLETHKPSKKLSIMLQDAAAAPRCMPVEYTQLFCMDWEEHVTKIMLPSLERNECVVCNCYVFSTLAYQVAQGISLEELSDALELCALAPMPTVVFLLDCDVHMVKLRRQARGLLEDENFEAKDAFQQLVREAYQSWHSWRMMRCVSSSYILVLTIPRNRLQRRYGSSLSQKEEEENMYPCRCALYSSLSSASSASSSSQTVSSSPFEVLITAVSTVYAGTL